MKKRILSLALVLAMLLSFVPAGVTAADPAHIHCMCGAEKTKDATCAECGTKAAEWTGITAMPATNEPGYYYLKNNVSVAPFFVTSGEFAFCLHGNTMTSAAGKRMFDISKGAVMSFTDCKDDCGTITGTTGSSGDGSAMCVSEAGVLNLYNGKVTGHTGANDGVIHAKVGTTTTAGGTFNMYGGEVSGNSSRRGAIFGALATGGKKPSVIRILGGTVTGNTGTGAANTNYWGGAGVYAMCTIEVGGDAKIYGNTAAKGPADLLVRNDQSAKLTLSTEKPMESGAKVHYGLWKAETDTTNLTAITGAPTNWVSSWVRYDGTKVGFGEGKFFLDNTPDHIHCLCGAEKTDGATCAACGTKAVEWEATKTFPTTDGFYYLSETVKTGSVNISGDISLCLHDKNLESASGANIVKLLKGGSLSVTSCSATPGSITGTKTACAVDIQPGGTFKLYGGKITGNTNTGNGMVWLGQGDASNIGGSFYMYGGEISGNDTGRGAVFTAIPANATNKTAVVQILGGSITGNTGTNNSTGTGTGGGAGIYSFSPVVIGGDAVISGNDAKVGPDDIFLRNDSANYTARLVVSDEVPLKDGANICYDLKVAETDTTDLKYITGTPESWSNTWVKYGADKVGYKDGKFLIDNSVPEQHIHCLCGAEKTKDANCAKCGTKAVLWTGIDAMPAITEPGYYYLKNNVSVAPFFISSGEFAFCLHGNTMTSAAGKRMFDVSGSAVLTITDCKSAFGSVTGTNGASGSSGGSAISISKGGIFNLYGGKVTGHTGALDGVIYAKNGEGTTAGGTFNMYGGEVSGNEVRRGAVFGALATGTQQPSVIRILGGTVTGNTGSGTGNFTGGAGVYAMCTIEVGGDAKIYGNRAAAGPADLYVRNDQGAKLVVSANVPLTEGANIQYSLRTEETDPTDLKCITGTPSAWNKAWVTYDGDAVDYADGKFFTKELPKHVHCMCGKETDLGETCADCGTEAVSWTGIDAMPAITEPGYYYLNKDVSVAPFFISSGEFAFCLCGNDMTSAAGKRMFDVSGSAVLTITDCKAAGTVTGTNGASGSSGGSAISISKGGIFNLYGGKITGHTGALDGVIYAKNGEGTTAGGTFNMYGGEVSGNEVRRGAIFGALDTTGKNPSVIRILGGTVTGNTGSGTGNFTGGAGVYAMHTVEIGGDAKIYGNRAAAGPADLYVRNDQGAKLVVSANVPLTDGANVCYGLYAAEADPMKLVYITGTPASWSMEWVKYDGDQVGYEDGRFYTKYALLYADHDHDDKKWVSVTQANDQLPTADGYYVLESDVTLDQTIVVLAGNHIHLCLNGKTLTAAKESAHFDVRAGGKLTVCDCTAKTAADGTYTAGKITGGSGFSGGSIRLRAGAELYLIDGIFTKNTCGTSGGNGGVLYMDAASAEYPASYFKMTGGQLCGNTGSYGGAIRMGAPSEGLAGPTFILEGGSICHNESINYGGALHAAGGADIQLKSGVIAENKAANGGGGISVNSQGIQGKDLISVPSTITLSGTTIRDNSATTWGGNVYIKTGTVLNMTGGLITGGSSKIGAGVLLESQGTTLNLKGGQINGNNGGAAGAAGVYASNNTIVSMTGGEISNNVSDGGGGGIVLYAAKGSFTGGSVSGNTAQGGGGGMCIQGSEVYLGKVTISGNTTAASAGGVYVARAGEVCSEVTIDGAQITNNTCKTSGGGIFLYMNGNKMTMEDGLIAGNQAADGGGVVAQRKVSFTMNGGQIKDNKATSNGGGYYASIDSTFVMNGGKISGNYTAKNGGGLYCLRANATLNGGTITGNKAKVSGGGVIVNGSTAKLAGTTVSYNSCEGSGAGIMVQTASMKVDGVSTKFVGKLTMTGGSVTGNTTPKAAAGVLINGNDSTFNFYGGSISYNIADKFGAGIYCAKNGRLNMSGGSVCYNESKLDAAGGVHVDAGIATFTGGEIHHNKAAKSAGGVMLARETGVVRMKNVKIYENEAKIGGGMVAQGKVDAVIESCEIYNNKSLGDAAGVYVSTYTKPVFKNCKFYGNASPTNGGALWSWATSYVTLEGCEFTGNTAGEQGGAIWTRGDGFYMTDCILSGNTAPGNGGAFYAGMMGSATPRKTPGLVFTGVTFEKNESGKQGGGLYVSSGAACTMTDCTFTGNQAAAEGGAFWAKDETTIHGLTVTGNQSGGEGFAVYLADSDFDGESFLAGLMKFSGSLKVHDNQGGDLYLGKQTAIVIGDAGLSEDTRIELTMHSGLLTDWVWGAYNYEGGDQVYTVTYGDRSLTDPEYAPAGADADAAQDAQSGNTVLYIGVGVFAVAVAAVVVLVLLKKKKTAQEAAKE